MGWWKTTWRFSRYPNLLTLCLSTAPNLTASLPKPVFPPAILPIGTDSLTPPPGTMNGRGANPSAPWIIFSRIWNWMLWRGAVTFIPAMAGTTLKTRPSGSHGCSLHALLSRGTSPCPTHTPPPSSPPGKPCPGLVLRPGSSTSTTPSPIPTTHRSLPIFGCFPCRKRKGKRESCL